MNIDRRKLAIILAGVWILFSIPLSQPLFGQVLESEGLLMGLFALVCVSWPVAAVFGWKWVTNNQPITVKAWGPIVGLGALAFLLSLMADNGDIAWIALLTTLAFCMLIYAYEGRKVIVEARAVSLRGAKLVVKILQRHKWLQITLKILGLVVLMGLAKAVAMATPRWVQFIILMGAGTWVIAWKLKIGRKHKLAVTATTMVATYVLLAYFFGVGLPQPEQVHNAADTDFNKALDMVVGEDKKQSAAMMEDEVIDAEARRRSADTGLPFVIVRPEIVKEHAAGQGRGQ